MRKLLLLAVFSFFLSSFAWGQACSPDPQYTNPSTQAGIHPDSVTNFDTAYVGIAYSQIVSIVIPPDTQAFPPPFPPVAWDSTRLDSVQGLPASLSYACWNTTPNSARCAWLGNSIGCAVISGTPVAGDIGTHALKFYTSNYLGGLTSSNGYVISYYKIVVLSASSVPENPKIQILHQNSPNPFAERSEIQFTAEDNGNAQFKIYNMIGTVIQEYDIHVKKGLNKLELDGKDFDSGIYFYSIVNGSNAFTRKMIVKK